MSRRVPLPSIGVVKSPCLLGPLLFVAVPEKNAPPSLWLPYVANPILLWDMHVGDAPEDPQMTNSRLLPSEELRRRLPIPDNLDFVLHVDKVLRSRTPITIRQPRFYEQHADALFHGSNGPFSSAVLFWSLRCSHLLLNTFTGKELGQSLVIELPSIVRPYDLHCS